MKLHELAAYYIALGPIMAESTHLPSNGSGDIAVDDETMLARRRNEIKDLRGMVKK